MLCDINFKENSWPLLVLAGASDTDQENMGAFQVIIHIFEYHLQWPRQHGFLGS